MGQVVRAVAPASLGRRVDTVLGGHERRRPVVLLACVLAVSSVDSGSVGALVPQLESTFHIGNTKIGLLVTISSLVAAAGSLPLGVLIDRYERVRILVVAVGVWAAATVLTGRR